MRILISLLFRNMYCDFSLSDAVISLAHIYPGVTPTSETHHTNIVQKVPDTDQPLLGTTVDSVKGMLGRSCKMLAIDIGSK